MTVWQLSMGRDDLSFITDFLQTYELPNTIMYEKGSAVYKTLPKVNDIIYVVCRSKLICKGYIYTDLEMRYNPNTFLTYEHYRIMITDIIYDQPYLKGQRRNYTQLKDKYILENY